jgi:thermitase
MSHKIKIILIYFSVLFLLRTAAMAYELRVNDDLLTIRAEQVLLQTLMSDFSQQTGIKIHMDPEINPAISADLINRPLETALKSILGHLDHVMKWERDPAKRDGQLRLTEIHIFNPGHKERMIPLDDERVLDIARNPKDGSFYVKNEILLRFKERLSTRQLNEILAEIGGTLVSENPAIHVYRIKLPPGTPVPDLLEQLSADPRVESAEPNYAYPIAQPFKYLTDRDIPPSTNSAGISGYGEAIAVLDSGLMPEKMPDSYRVETYNALAPDSPISDPLGHGTQMVMIASGFISPMGIENTQNEANPVIAIQAFDKNGFMSSDILMRSVEIALENNAKVISMSWGSETKSDFVGEIIDYGVSKGLVFVASAGNKPTGKPVYPASYENVINVGTLTPDGTQWDNSNFGDFVDGFVPGFASMPVGYLADPGIYAGTSISTAYAAQQIAAFLSKNPGAEKAALLDHLFKKP